MIKRQDLLKIRRNSPQFGKLVFWIQTGKRRYYRRFFRVEQERDGTFSWIKSGYAKGAGKRWTRALNLTELRVQIQSELVDPLFNSAGINIKDEDNIARHRKDNLICCCEFYLRKLKQRVRALDCGKIQAGFRTDNILDEFRECFETIIRTADRHAVVAFPFSRTRLLQAPKGDLAKLKRHSAELEEQGEEAWTRAHSPKLFDLNSDQVEAKIKKYQELWEEKEKTDFEIARIEQIHELNQSKFLIKYVEFFLKWFMAARGKRGRHPKPFNVFAYHVINKCTRRKQNMSARLRGEKNIDVLRKDGQHRLERDWAMIIFLILDAHLTSTKIPEIGRFIRKNEKRPAEEVLKSLKNMLWNIYKNFPQMEGWSFPRSHPDTGFRKLIVEKDHLRIVTL